MTVIAYVRQLKRADLDQQVQHDIISIRPAPDLLFEDRNNSRDGLKAAFAELRQGDVLCVARLSQFGLGIGQLLKFVAELRMKGAHLVSPSDGINTTDSAGWDFYLHMLALLAMEKQLARERMDVELLTIGRARGRRGGRPKKLSPEAVAEARRLLHKRRADLTIKILADKFGCSRSTFYKTVIEGRFGPEA